MKKYLRITELFIFLSLLLISCSSGDGNDATPNVDGPAAEVVETNDAPVDPMQNKGIGPVSSVELTALDESMAAQGKEIFTAKCEACHKVDERYIGPAIAGITERRTPEWIMNMILNPEEMVKKDPIARDLLAEYLAPMANQNLTEEEARKILEFFRTI